MRQHSVQNVLAALEPADAPVAGTELPCAADWFVGFLLLDAVILNTDRHHENWAVMQLPSGSRLLAPSYDHASSLGRELQDEERKERLRTRDTRRSVTAYVARARSGLYGDETSQRPGVSERSGTCPVGSAPEGRGRFGQLDLAGNVWEWTASLFSEDQAVRVDRGGGWDDGVPAGVSAAIRGGDAPSFRCNFLGVRCAR